MEIADPRLKGAARAAWVLSLLSYLGGVGLAVAFVGPQESNYEVVAMSIENMAFVAVATLAILILRRQPANLVAWGAMLAGVAYPLEEFVSRFTGYAFATWGPSALTLFAGWVARWIWIPGNLAIPIILLYYPNSKLVSPMWRMVVYFMWALAMGTFLLVAFDPSPMQEFDGLPNPMAVEAVASVPHVFWVVLPWGLYLIPPLLGALSLIPRYVRSEGIERQQMKVIALVGVVASAFFVVQGAVFEVDSIADSIVTTLFVLFVGAALTAGIVRYRVFEIDRIISRTVSYAIVIVLLGLVFAAGVVWVPTALGSQDSPFLVAATTLAVAALFNPLRRTVQQAVERRFNRSKVQADEVANQFSSRLQTANDVDEIGDLWLSTVVASLGPESAGLWLNRTNTLTE